MKSRTPSDPGTPAWTPRRSVGGARKECTERVTVRQGDFETKGWTLNISRGGLRAVVEERLSLDVEYEILVGDAATPRRVRLVWSQDQADGQIVGLKYLDVEATMPPREGSTPPQEE